MTFAALRAAAASANRELAATGLVELSFGNASAVDPGRGVFAIKPSGLPCHQMTPEDAVVVSLEDGEVVWGDQRPSSDTPTHLVLYRDLPTVGGLVHTHSPFATAWAQARRPIPCLGTTHADHARGEIPVTRSLRDDEISGEYETNTGGVVAELFVDGLDPRDLPGVLVAGHGPFVWGDDAAGAVRNAVALELIAKLAFYTLTLNPVPESPSTALLDRHFSRKHGPAAYYGQP